MSDLVEINENCPFCRKDIVSSAFMESEHFIAIYNIAPILRGHSLVISRKHIKSLFELSSAELAEFSVFSREVTQLLLEAFKGEGFDWSIQEGASAGQSVPHLHLHIVNRRKNDLYGLANWYPRVQENEAGMLDSASRTRLSEAEHLFYTDYLKNEITSQHLNQSLEKE
jgi:bis(5'-adenosyl)-triphosphatase